MNIWTDIFIPYILPLIGTLLSALGTWLAKVLIDWFNEKIKDKKTASMLVFITNAVSNAVKVVYQTYVEHIKGTESWTKEAQAEALNKALVMAKKQLTLEALEFIEKYYGDIDEYISNLIETVLYNLKNGSTDTTNLNIEK